MNPPPVEARASKFHSWNNQQLERLRRKFSSVSPWSGQELSRFLTAAHPALATWFLAYSVAYQWGVGLRFFAAATLVLSLGFYLWEVASLWKGNGWSFLTDEDIIGDAANPAHDEDSGYRGKRGVVAHVIALGLMALVFYFGLPLVGPAFSPGYHLSLMEPRQYAVALGWATAIGFLGFWQLNADKDRADDVHVPKRQDPPAAEIFKCLAKSGWNATSGRYPSLKQPSVSGRLEVAGLAEVALIYCGVSTVFSSISAIAWGIKNHSSIGPNAWGSSLLLVSYAVLILAASAYALIHGLPVREMSLYRSQKSNLAAARIVGDMRDYRDGGEGFFGNLRPPVYLAPLYFAQSATALWAAWYFEDEAGKSALAFVVLAALLQALVHVTLVMLVVAKFGNLSFSPWVLILLSICIAGLAFLAGWSLIASYGGVIVLVVVASGVTLVVHLLFAAFAKCFRRNCVIPDAYLFAADVAKSRINYRAGFPTMSSGPVAAEVDQRKSCGR